ncbi:TPA: hypothetical protein HA235_03515 [Candidatus Woesearchaeota archaeon]|nr:hypothetical protein [Candidatus Woesearchaeota archaeon]HIH31751.1 hypothetical protein [Candidatus Woesearchaeota archaeon]HIH54688.1 hypothetical protein [Candidatus Woesearchaeota archaeon]HIJ02580.1 hypothetical protein [Candidatus Woesearchaeota archaeon]HIJ13978.1 hypothetical protein [Candidatus Woesearchaeota archaeon]
MNWKKFLGLAKEIIARSFFYITVWLSIICLLITLLLLAIAGFSAEGAFNAFHNHPIWVIIGILLSQIITITLPPSITGILSPEPVVSKVGGILGISGSTLTAIILFIMMLFIAGLGLIVFTIMGIVFIFFALLIRKYISIKKSLLFRTSGVLSIIIGLLFLITIFVAHVFRMSTTLGIVGIIISILLIAPGILVFFTDKKWK